MATKIYKANVETVQPGANDVTYIERENVFRSIVEYSQKSVVLRMPFMKKLMKKRFVRIVQNGDRSNVELFINICKIGIFYIL